jgi:hypothetical protein
MRMMHLHLRKASQCEIALHLCDRRPATMRHHHTTLSRSPGTDRDLRTRFRMEVQHGIRCRDTKLLQQARARRND